MLNSGFICTRDFSSFRSKPRNILSRHKALGWTREESRKYFLKRFMTNCKLPLSNKSASAIPVCYSTTLSPPSCLPSVKSCSVAENFPPPLPHCQELISLLRSVLYPKSVERPLFSKIGREKCSLGCPESSRSAPFSQYLKRFKYPLKRELTTGTSQSSCPHSLSQELSKGIQKAPKRFPRSQRNKTPVYRGPSHPIFLRRIHWRGFHSSSFPLAKSDSNKPSGSKSMDKICKPTVEKNECGRPCKKKSDVCHEEKVKCDKSQQSKREVKQQPKVEERNVDRACRKTCLPIGKCELPHTDPPPKMEYMRVTCPPPKLVKPKSCPPTLEDLRKDDDMSHAEIKQTGAGKKKICAPPPLPKPPYAPIVLCRCPPPRKIHPGPCPCYVTKEINKRLKKIQPCPLKKKYPCPTGIYYCPLQKKPCKLGKPKNRCEDRKKK